MNKEELNEKIKIFRDIKQIITKRAIQYARIVGEYSYNGVVGVIDKGSSISLNTLKITTIEECQPCEKIGFVEVSYFLWDGYHGTYSEIDLPDFLGDSNFNLDNILYYNDFTQFTFDEILMPDKDFIDYINRKRFVKKIMN